MISPEVFRRYPHFAGIEDACLRELGKLSEERSFKAKEEIFSESGAFVATSRIYEKGEEASHLMLLTEGNVDVLLTLGTGEKVVVGTLVSGDLAELVLGDVQGRGSDTDRTAFIFRGYALGDFALAALAFQKLAQAAVVSPASQHERSDPG